MADAQPAPIGDNSKGLEEAERVQLLSYVSKLNANKAAVEKAKAPFDEAKKALTQTFRLAKAAGFLRKDLEEYLDKMNDGTRDIVADERRRRRHFEWLGIVGPEQLDVFTDATPTFQQDEAHWRGIGYRDGLQAKEGTAPPECPAAFVQMYMQSRDSGFKDMQAALAANVPGAHRLKPAASVVGDPAEVGAKAAADFAEDNPDALAAQTPRRVIKAKQEAEIPDPDEVAKAARALKKKEGFLPQ